MTEIATLGLRVDGTANIDSATTSLDRFSKSGRDAETAAGSLSKGSQTSSKSLAEVARQSDRASSSMTSLSNVARRVGGVIAAALSTRALVNYADSWTNMTSRVELSIGAHEDASAVMGQLADISRQTYATMESTTEAFARNSFTLRALGKSTQDQINFTAALNNALAVSGAEGERALMVQNSLSRAMAEGTLRGEDLNNVLNSGSRVAELLADNLGINVTQLRAVAADGRITSAVIYDSLVGAMEELSAESMGMGSTVRGSMRLMSNATLEAVGQLNQMYDVSGTVARRIVQLSDAIRGIDWSSHAGWISATAVVTAGATGAYVAYRGAVIAATAAQALFNAAVTANPLGLIVTAAGAAVGALYYYREELGLVDGAAQNTADAIAASAGAIQAGSQAALDANYDNLVNSLEAVSLQAQEAMAQLVELEARQRFYERAHQGVADSVAGAVDQQTAALAQLWERQVELKRAIRENREARDNLTSAENDGINTGEIVINVTRGVTSETEKLTKAQRDAIRESERFASSLQSLQDRLFPVEAAQREYAEQQAVLTRAWNEGTISADRYTEAMRRLEQAQLSTQTPGSAYGGIGFGSQIGDPAGGMGARGEGDYWDRWLASAETALTDFDQLAANTAENFQRGFGNAFESMVFDSQSLGDAMYNLTEGIARSMVSALGEMAAQWLAYQAVQMMVGRTTQSSAASTMITNAMAQQQMAGLNAFSSVAAIPIVGPFMAPGAMAAAIAATSPSVAAISSLAVAGMAHDGIDSIPREGTWLLDKGERVLNAPQAARLDQFLDQHKGGGMHRGGGVTVNLIENPNRGGEVVEREGDNGERFIDIFVADIAQGGRASRAIESTYGVRRQGR